MGTAGEEKKAAKMMKSYLFCEMSLKRFCVLFICNHMYDMTVLQPPEKEKSQVNNGKKI